MRLRSHIRTCLLVGVVALVASGCGSPRRVTYVDPNGPTAPGRGGTAEPVARFGTASLERAKAFVRIRAALAVGRTLAASDRAAAAAGVSSAIEEDLAFVEPRLVTRDARLAAALRSGLEGLVQRPPANAVGYTREVRRLSALVDRSDELVVGSGPRQDVGFRADLLYETLTEASVDYEAGFDGGTDRITMPDQYRRAYGLVIDASTRQLEAVPENARGVVRAALDRVSRRSLPGPTPPATPRNPDKVLGELGAVADQVVESAGIDPTAPTTDADVPDQLRSLKRGVAAAVETWERGDHPGGLAQLATADREHLQPSASGVAAVSVALLSDVERGVLVDLPRAMRAGGDVVAVGADVDANIDEAVTQVEAELELLRDSG